MSQKMTRAMLLFWSIGKVSMPKNARGSLPKIHSSAPDFVLKELRKLRLTRALKCKLTSEYGISL